MLPARKGARLVHCVLGVEKGRYNPPIKSARLCFIEHVQRSSRYSDVCAEINCAAHDLKALAHVR